MMDDTDPQSSSSYWQPALTGIKHNSNPFRRVYRESIFLSVRRFFAFLIYFLIRKIVSLFQFAAFILRFGFNIKEKARAYAIRTLLHRRGSFFRPASHGLVLSMTFGLLFMGGGMGNIILGRGEAQGIEYYYEDDTVERELSTHTQVPDSRPAEELTEYTVKGGDTLSEIGEKFKVSVESIRFANSITGEHLTVGQTLTIPPVSGAVVEVGEGDTVEKLAQKFNVPPQAIVDFNYLSEPFILEVGQEVVIPDARIPAAAPAPNTPSVPSSGTPLASAPAAPGVAGSGNWVWPTNERYVTQFFSGWHPAIDIAKDSPLYAADAGTVVEASSNGSWNWGYGNYVKIDHGNGYSTMYAHMEYLNVSVGDVVGAGQVIGDMGNTGRSFGTHVHFIVQYEGQYINPLSVL